MKTSDTAFRALLSVAFIGGIAVVSFVLYFRSGVDQASFPRLVATTALFVSLIAGATTVFLDRVSVGRVFFFIASLVVPPIALWLVFWAGIVVWYAGFGIFLALACGIGLQYGVGRG